MYFPCKKYFVGKEGIFARTILEFRDEIYPIGLTHEKDSSLIIVLFEDILNNWSVRSKYKHTIVQIPR